MRTRRISPFGSVGALFRRVVDPLIVPVERRVVRSGGLPASAPWWALVVVVLGGLVFLALMEFVRGQLAFAAAAGGAGTRGVLAVLITWTFGILQLALIVRVISSWVRLSELSRWVLWGTLRSGCAPSQERDPPLAERSISRRFSRLLLAVVKRCC